MKIILSFIILFYSITGFAQSAESVLNALHNKFDSILDLTADVKQKSNGKTSLSGKLFFKKKNIEGKTSHLRMEFANQIIVADGTTSWNYNKKDKKVIISSYDENGAGLLSINYLIYEYPKECDLSLASDGNKQILVLKPKSKKNRLGEVKLYLTQENLIEKVRITNQSTGSMELRFSNYKLNQNLSDSKFTFTAPEGTTVVDLR